MASRRVERLRPLAAVVAVVTGAGLPVFLTGGQSVQIRAEMRFGEAGLGLAVGIFFMAACLTSAALGRVAERLGPSRSMRASAIASAVASLAIALFARSLTTLLIGLAAAGVANAMAQPAANLFLARTVDRRRLGLAFAIKQAGLPAGAMLAGLAVPTVALTVGWRWSFVAAAGLAVAGAFAVVGTRQDDALAPEAAVPRRPPLRPLAVLALAMTFGAAAPGALAAFLVASGVEAGMQEGAAGLLVSAGSGLGVAVRIVAGHRADRRDGGHLRVVSWMLAVGAVGYLLFAPGSVPLMIIATPIAFGAGWGWPGLFNLAVVREHPDAAARASGITQTGTYLGAVLGPLLFGSVVEASSYRVGWLMASACSLVAAAGMAWGRMMIRKSRAMRDVQLASQPAGGV